MGCARGRSSRTRRTRSEARVGAGVKKKVRVSWLVSSATRACVYCDESLPGPDDPLEDAAGTAAAFVVVVGPAAALESGLIYVRLLLSSRRPFAKGPPGARTELPSFLLC